MEFYMQAIDILSHYLALLHPDISTVWCTSNVLVVHS